jgi:sterol desaturase/sphingolipid hydroxylase (fatty acid hydroxylase superfamily)
MKYKSIQIFALINIPLVSLASLEYSLFYSVAYPYLFLYISMLLKNVGMAYILDWLNRDNPYIVARSEKVAFHIGGLQTIVSVSLVDLVTLYIALAYSTVRTDTWGTDYLLFIPRSFCFELVFDFFHYCFHRMCHTVPYLYKHIHSHHHANSAITVYTTFEQHPLDLVLTNMLPILFTAALMAPNHHFMFLFFWYKSFLEISGHLGKENKGLSFPQCIWISKALGISLKSKDHNYHHIRPLKNFSKRFSLWDKVFGTFEE